MQSNSPTPEKGAQPGILLHTFGVPSTARPTGAHELPLRVVLPPGRQPRAEGRALTREVQQVEPSVMGYP